MAKTVLLSRAGMAHLALAAALVGASYLSSFARADSPPVAEGSLEILVQGTTHVSPGESVLLRVRDPVDGRIVSGAIEWVVSPRDRARVSPEGRLRAVASGLVRLEARARGRFGVYHLLVTDAFGPRLPVLREVEVLDWGQRVHDGCLVLSVTADDWSLGLRTAPIRAVSFPLVLEDVLGSFREGQREAVPVTATITLTGWRADQIEGSISFLRRGQKRSIPFASFLEEDAGPFSMAAVEVKPVPGPPDVDPEKDACGTYRAMPLNGPTRGRVVLFGDTSYDEREFLSQVRWFSSLGLEVLAVRARSGSGAGGCDVASALGRAMGPSSDRAVPTLVVALGVGPDHVPDLSELVRRPVGLLAVDVALPSGKAFFRVASGTPVLLVWTAEAAKTHHITEESVRQDAAGRAPGSLIHVEESAPRGTVYGPHSGSRAAIRSLLRQLFT